MENFSLVSMKNIFSFRSGNEYLEFIIPPDRPNIEYQKHITVIDPMVYAEYIKPLSDIHGQVICKSAGLS